MTLDSDRDAEYWEGCLTNNYAFYDIPALILLIKEYSNVEKVSVIAHSLGTYDIMIGLQLNSTFYKQSVNHVSLLSPFHTLKATFHL